MGVYTKTYVLIGYDLIPIVNKKDEDQLNGFLEEMEVFAENKGLDFIYDGMSGEYCFLGKVLNECDEEQGMPIREHHLSQLQAIQNEVYDSVQNLTLDDYPALYSFTHWY